MGLINMILWRVLIHKKSLEKTVKACRALEDKNREKPGFVNFNRVESAEYLMKHREYTADPSAGVKIINKFHGSVGAIVSVKRSKPG